MTSICHHCIYRSQAFDSLTEEQLEEISQVKHEEAFKRGEIIYNENAPIKEFMYLKKGLVKLVTHKWQKEHIISIAKPGDFIGLLSIFSRENHPHSIVAIEPTEVCFVPLDTLTRQVEANGTFALSFFRKISSVSDQVLETRNNINTRQLRGRIAFILLFFAEEVYQSETFELPVSRKEIGELIDMSTENVIRALSEFRKDEIIAIEGKTIDILDKPRLKKIYQLG